MLIVESIENVESRILEDFFCGNDELDRYLKEYAKQNHNKGIGKSFVALAKNQVVGYYTISTASIEFNEVPQAYTRGIPKYPIPVARIGRLAIEEQLQGKKIGSSLLIHALKKIHEVSKTIAVYAVVVDAKNEMAKNFYIKFGFEPYKGDFSLYLPMKTVTQLLSGNKD